MGHANVRTERIEELSLAQFSTGNYLQAKLPSTMISTVIRGVHDRWNMKHNQAKGTNEWLYEYLHHV
jgi:hypothetical protein